MRQLLREWVSACGMLLAAVPATATAQQGSVQISAATHTLSAERSRVGDTPAFEPDLGISWLQPATPLGTFRLDVHGTARDGRPHLGRALLSLRDLKYRGVSYGVEAGDAFFSTNADDHRFRNLFTPSINFSGLSATASTARTDAAVMFGRATTTRNLFGTDVRTLDQGLLVVRGSHKASKRLTLSTRVSRIRTRDVEPFTFTIADSDQAGGGARVILTPAVHLVGHASLVRYRFRDDERSHVDSSLLAGGSVLLARGWIQVNASRFSPGELPVLSQPLADRRTLYAAGDYDVFRHVRVFGAWEAFEGNGASQAAGRAPTDGARAIGGVRVPLGLGSSASVRIEQGDRRTRLRGAAEARVSDTGVVSADLQTALGPVNAFGRFARRENVESEHQAGSYTQQESSALAYVNVDRALQLFGSVTAVRNDTRGGTGRLFWQFGGGLQSRAVVPGLWLRGEALFSRTADLLTERTVPQQTYTVGLNGQLTRDTALTFSLFADRLPAGFPDPLNPWLVRTSLRVTRTFLTSASASASSAIGPAARHGGTGSLVGFVYTDWNMNGAQDPGEQPLENIPIRLASLGHTSTSGDGEFAFINVPIGLHEVGIDMMALPVDFDPPRVPQVQVQLGRGETHRLAFGLIPLGSIGGRVLRDVNGNGVADPADEPIDAAVLVLDGGARSEQARGGRFRFDAVRAGEHAVDLLLESLPDGSSVVGTRSRTVGIGSGALAQETAFLVRIQSRPEVRKVFPVGGATPARRAPFQPTAPPMRRPSGAASARSPRPYAIQIAALSDPSRAARLVDELRARGYSAYLVQPPAPDPHGPYRVRIGFYEDRAGAERDARLLEQERGEKLWVVRER